jgi:DNA-binding NarL/FixJ family response regulator
MTVNPRLMTSWDVQLTCPDCGFVTKPTSQAYAVKSLRVHSCERFREAAAIAKRKAARATDSGVSRPCTHKTVTHEHGDYLRYVTDRCRCRKCRDAIDQQSKGRGRHAKKGCSPYVDPAPVAAHLRELLAAGMTGRRISTVSGVRDETVRKLLRNPPKRMQRATAARLMAVKRPFFPPHTPMDVTGTRRRVQALMCMGWSVNKIAAKSGVDRVTVSAVLQDRTVHVYSDTARALRACYDQLWRQPPPEDTRPERSAATLVRSVARTRGYVSPLAWNDATIDDPSAVPEGVVQRRTATAGCDDMVVERVAAGERIEMTVAERSAVVRRLHGQGMTDQDIGRRTGIPPRTVFRVRVRLGLPAINSRAAAA